MIKKLFALCLLSLACGGSPEDFSDEEASDIGQTEAAIVAPRNASYVMGASQAQSALRCTPTSATQNCNVPITRTFKYCASGLNAEELLDLRAVVLGGEDSQHHFTWTELFNGTTPVRDAACTTAALNGQVNVIVNSINNFCAAAGATATNIDSLVCMNATVVTPQLPESPSVPGNFFGTNGGVIHIDRARLLAAFPLASDRSKARQHGLGHSSAAIDGLGARTETNEVFLWTRRQVSPLSSVGRTLSAGEDCTLRFYSSSPANQYNQNSTNCIGLN